MEEIQTGGNKIQIRRKENPNSNASIPSPDRTFSRTTPTPQHFSFRSRFRLQTRRQSRPRLLAGKLLLVRRRAAHRYAAWRFELRVASSSERVNPRTFND